LLFADILVTLPTDSAPPVYLILLLFPVDNSFKLLNKRGRNVQVVSGIQCHERECRIRVWGYLDLLILIFDHNVCTRTGCRDRNLRGSPPHGRVDVFRGGD
jgi:hypothetical protein